MQKKYQVFLSSTFEDLKYERSTVLHALLSHGSIIPSGMELFPASNTDQWSHIEKVISESDYYIVIVAGRYGSCGEDGISYTEREFGYAKKAGIPILSFIHQDIASIPEPKRDAGEKLKQLNSFREIIKQDHLCKFWKNEAELVSGILIGLGNLIQSNPGVGWIRGDEVIDPTEMLAIQKENDELRKSLEIQKTEPIFKDIAPLSSTVTFSYKHTYSGPVTTATATVTWEAILRFIGPELFAPKYDYLFDQLVQSFIKKTTRSGTVYDYNEIAAKIKMQFFAMGIIKESGRVMMKSGGHATNWELTPQGRMVVAQLVAEKAQEKK